MNITLEVISITILTRPSHSDYIYIKFNGTKPFPIAEEPPMLQMEVTKGTGVKYVQENFGIEPKVIEAK